MPTITVQIGPDNFYPKKGSLSIRSHLMERTTCNFTLEKPARLPEVGEPVLIWLDGVRLFFGSIESRRLAGLSDLLWQKEVVLTCVDRTHVLDRYRVFGLFESSDTKKWWASDVVKWIIQNYLALDGITEGTIEVQPTTDPPLKRVAFNYMKASDAVRQLAELVGWTWWVDENAKLHFVSRPSNRAPIGIKGDSATGIRLVSGLTLTESRERLRNVQYLRGGLGTGNERTEKMKGRHTADGGQSLTEMLVQFPIGNTDDDPPTVIVQERIEHYLDTDGDGLSDTRTVENIDRPQTVSATQTTGVDWYYQTGERFLRKPAGDSGIVINQSLVVTYRPAVSVMIQTEDELAISQRASVEGFTGRYEELEISDWVDSLETAHQRADRLVERFKNPTRVLEYDTRTDGFRAGQVQAIQLSQLPNVTGEWLIEMVEATDRAPHALSYHVRAVDGEAIGDWVNELRKLARRDMILDAGTTLLRVWKGPQQFMKFGATAVFSGSSGIDTSRVGVALVGTAKVGEP